MCPRISPHSARNLKGLLAGAFAFLLALACTTSGFAAAPKACPSDGRVLRFGFYAFFKPLSYSADAAPKSPGFKVHRGYEADLLDALEAMKGADLSFSRSPIAQWESIWLLPAGTEYDMVGGGITILDSRTRDAARARAVVFTSGHVAFRQSLLVRAADAARLPSHDRLTSSVRVGALAGTTGEARLLQLTGLANAAGVLAAGTRAEMAHRVVVADGGANYVINASGASSRLLGRRRLLPPAETMPQVIYLGEKTGEAALLAALRERRIDAVAGVEIGNSAAAHASGGAFAVTALGPIDEYGGFALSVKDAELAACISDKIDWLTSGRRIGYREWHADPSVFMRRANLWKGWK